MIIPSRGSLINPQNRFEQLRREMDVDMYQDDIEEEEKPMPRTLFLRDANGSAAKILTKNKSPDLGFQYSLNPYRGCEHGCAYCYARPTHEYLGFSPGLDFETKIVVKHDAPSLLHSALADLKWQPEVVMMSGVTDCYQPAEQRFRLTRGCLEVFANFCNPVGIVTKNYLVTRDIDILSRLAVQNAVSVTLSITSLDPDLSRRLEPRASLPSRRLAAVEKLNAAGIPVSVNVAPIIPGLNDHEIPAIVAAAAQAGACGAGCSLVRFPFGVKEIFIEWLATHFPEKMEGVLGRIRNHRNGELSDPNFGTRMTGTGPYAENVMNLFRVACARANFPEKPPLSITSFRRGGEISQRTLFDF